MDNHENLLREGAYIYKVYIVTLRFLPLCVTSAHAVYSESSFGEPESVRTSGFRQLYRRPAFSGDRKVG
jgi:hypothetical protein